MLAEESFRRGQEERSGAQAPLVWEGCKLCMKQQGRVRPEGKEEGREDAEQTLVKAEGQYQVWGNTLGAEGSVCGGVWGCFSCVVFCITCTVFLMTHYTGFRCMHGHRRTQVHTHAHK